MNKNQTATNLFIAPGVFSGGGGVLLKSILDTMDNTWVIYLDERAASLVKKDLLHRVKFVKNKFFSRCLFEIGLFIKHKQYKHIFCFHGVPPFFPLRGKVFIFVQNRLFVSQASLKEYAWGRRIKVMLGRFLFKYCMRSNYTLIVQTDTMSRMIRNTFQEKYKPLVLPFFEPKVVQNRQKKQYDFYYVADSQPHKNHKKLIDAWRILADQGFYPFLALTISEDSDLSRKLNKKQGLNIEFLGTLSPKEAMQLSAASSALIFPSYQESFGLPLLEAAAMGKPVLAGECDFVRDVVSPQETFDPHSAFSIARAVMRFCDKHEKRMHIHSAEEFMKEVCQ